MAKTNVRQHTRKINGKTVNVTRHDRSVSDLNMKYSKDNHSFQNDPKIESKESIKDIINKHNSEIESITNKNSSYENNKSKFNDLNLTGWKLTALKELSKKENESFKNTYNGDNRLQDREGFVVEGNGEYLVFKNYETAKNACRDYVREQIEEEPELFNQDFIRNHSYISDIDMNIIAQEESEFNREIYEEEGLDEEEIEKRIDSDYDEIYDSLKNDPFEYFVEERGLYSAEDYYNQPFVQIDEREAAEEAINIDGVAHFFASYDGDEIYLPSGAVAYRIN